MSRARRGNGSFENGGGPPLSLRPLSFLLPSLNGLFFLPESSLEGVTPSFLGLPPSLFLTPPLLPSPLTLVFDLAPLSLFALSPLAIRVGSSFQFDTTL